MPLRFTHADFPPDTLRARKRRTVSVVLPARECAATVGQVVERIASLGDLVDEVLVVDAGSRDGTAERAAAAGARVVQQDDLVPRAGPVLGKGDAMWRSLAVATGELIVFVDADTIDFSAAFITGLLGPLIVRDDVSFSKAAYRRPFTIGATVLDGGGGRVSQLTARPLLAAFYPALAELHQPLAGEIAAPRELFERLPFTTGYGVEMAMLLDVLALTGADAIAEVDVGERRNAHQPLDALRPMAETVLAVISDRLWREGRLTERPAVPPPERPPFATLWEPAG